MGTLLRAVCRKPAGSPGGFPLLGPIEAKPSVATLAFRMYHPDFRSQGTVVARLRPFQFCDLRGPGAGIWRAKLLTLELLREQCGVHGLRVPVSSTLLGAMEELVRSLPPGVGSWNAASSAWVIPGDVAEEGGGFKRSRSESVGAPASSSTLSLKYTPYSPSTPKGGAMYYALELQVCCTPS